MRTHVHEKFNAWGLYQSMNGLTHTSQSWATLIMNGHVQSAEDTAIMDPKVPGIDRFDYHRLTLL